mmetsp:Transcript_11894/g.26041  ORF Transcript_11894/g.26041 Transcript_11894/m.26041 type:complete len:122 (+) Transcript_11894:627-992(+)
MEVEEAVDSLAEASFAEASEEEVLAMLVAAAAWNFVALHYYWEEMVDDGAEAVVAVYWFDGRVVEGAHYYFDCLVAALNVDCKVHSVLAAAAVLYDAVMVADSVADIDVALVMEVDGVIEL